MEKKIDSENPAASTTTVSSPIFLERENEDSTETLNIRSERLERYLRNLAFKIKLLYGRR